MIKTNNPKVKYLIDAKIKKSGSDFTASLADLGGGSMPQGALNLWKDGEMTGVVEGVAALALLGAACILAQKAIHRYRIKRTIEATIKDVQREEGTTNLTDRVNPGQTDECNEEYAHEGGMSYEIN